MQRNITFKDIAREAGVSKTTVSYAFSGYPGVALDTKKKVFDIAEKYNYKPNHFARALNTKRTKTIGAVFTNTLGDFMGDIVKGIETATWQHGYHMLLSTCNDDQTREKSHIETLLYKGVDGLIVFLVSPRTGQKFDYSHLTDLRKKNVPLVLIDRYLPGEDIDYVVADDFGGIYEAVNYMIRLGHERIAYLSRSDDCTPIRNRLEGYKKALVDAGIEVREEYIGTPESLTREAVYEVTEGFLRLEGRPTVILSVTGVEAVEAFYAVKEHGLRVPQDIAVISFGGNTALSALLESPAQVIQPTEEMGEKAAQILIKRIENPDNVELTQISIEPTLFIPTSGERRYSMLCK